MSLFVCSAQGLGSETKRRKLGSFGRNELRALSVIGRGVFVAKSELPGAGQGLFALTHFNPGDPITAYEPIDIISLQASEESSNDEMAYAMHFRAMSDKVVVIVGAEQARYGAPGASFANDPLMERKVNTVYQPIDLAGVEGDPGEDSDDDDEEQDETYEVSPSRSAKAKRKSTPPTGRGGDSRSAATPDTKAKWEYGEFLEGSALVLVASKPINAGDEIYACYGSSYWLGEPGDPEVRGDPRQYEPDIFKLSRSPNRHPAIRYPRYDTQEDAVRYNPYPIAVVGANPPAYKSVGVPADAFTLPGDMSRVMYDMIHTTLGVPKECNVRIGQGDQSGYFAPRPDERRG